MPAVGQGVIGIECRAGDSRTRRLVHALRSAGRLRRPGVRLAPATRADAMSMLDGIKAAQVLKEAGFTKVSNLTGGILAWADQIDPSMPKY